MDKFGIFKLLNSFFDFYKQRSSEQKGDASASPLSLFSSAQATSNPPTPNFQNQDSSEQNKVNEKKPPLQNGMLFTMKNHDNIVNRVKNNK